LAPVRSPRFPAICLTHPATSTKSNDKVEEARQETAQGQKIEVYWIGVLTSVATGSAARSIEGGRFINREIDLKLPFAARRQRRKFSRITVCHRCIETPENDIATMTVAMSLLMMTLERFKPYD